MHIGIGWWVVIGLLGLTLLARKYPHYRAFVFGHAGRLLGGVGAGVAGNGNLFTRNWRKILLGLALGFGVIVALAGFGVIAWSPFTWLPQWRAPHLNEVGPFVWYYWLPIVIVWVLLGVLIAVLKLKNAQGLLAFAMLMLFFGIPTMVGIGNVWDWLFDSANTLEMYADGDTEHLTLARGQVASFTGSGFSTHVKFTDGTECTLGQDQNNLDCSGPMLEEWAHDETHRPNSVTYVFLQT